MTTVRFVAGGVTFEWEPAKAASNRRKHGVTFEEAATAFLDPLGTIFDDPDYGGGEPRFLLVGLSAKTRRVLVVHIERGESLRIISARLATRRERYNLEGEG